MRFVHYMIATALGAGYSPIAPGTAGTIIGALSAFFIFEGAWLPLVIASISGGIIGTVSASYVERHDGTEDPSKVVIDEVVGMWIGLIFLPPDPLLYLIAFGLFRLFDVTKLYPIDSLQDLPGGIGIMMDDVGAGIYTLIVMQVLIYFL